LFGDDIEDVGIGSIPSGDAVGSGDQGWSSPQTKRPLPLAGSRVESQGSKKATGSLAAGSTQGQGLTSVGSPMSASCSDSQGWKELAGSLVGQGSNAQSSGFSYFIHTRKDLKDCWRIAGAIGVRQLSPQSVTQL
jgi:hypothetical protein